jgi:formate hydrogenlyase subunit 6/NADH:ubiquinone oxidoreductase subunit I
LPSKSKMLLQGEHFLFELLEFLFGLCGFCYICHVVCP